MQTVKKRLTIIGLMAVIGLTVPINNVFAIYSSRLSQQAAIIRQHIMESQAQTGSKNVWQEYQQFVAYDKAKQEAFEETGISGNARIAQDLIFKTSLDFLISHPFDSLMMVFNFNAVNGQFISKCLRDDIWSLELLRDKVGAEMLKAYMLRDTYHGALLMEDYKYLTTNLTLLRKYGAEPSAKIDATDAKGNAVTITSTKYFFGNEGTNPNYYNAAYSWISNQTGCPEDEFQTAFQEVVNASKTFATLSSGGGSDWNFDNIWQMAGENARIRAKQWIRANQISLTIGSEEGGRVESLVKAGGWDKFKGYWKTQWQILKNMVGPVTPLIDVATNYKAPPGNEAVGNNCRFFHQGSGYFTVCNTEELEQWKKCKKDKAAAENVDNIRCDRFRNAGESISMLQKLGNQQMMEEEHAETLEDVWNAFNYSITLDSVAEQNIYQMDQIMWDLNQNIKRGYEGVSQEAAADGSIPTLTKKVAKMRDKQCANKQ